MGYEQFGAVLVGRGAHGHPIGNVVTADNHAARVYAGVSYIAFKLLCVTQCFHHERIVAAQLGLEVVDIFVAVLECGLQLLSVDFGHVLGDELGQAVALGKR